MDHREVDIVAAAFCAAEWRALSYEARRPYRIAALQAIKALDAHRSAKGGAAEPSMDLNAEEDSAASISETRGVAGLPVPKSVIAVFALTVLLLATGLALRSADASVAELLAGLGGSESAFAPK